MTENPTSPRNDPASVDDEVEEAMKRLEIVSNGDVYSRTSGEEVSFPDRPGEPDCIYYLRKGYCGYGTKCRFNHPSNGGNGNGSKNGELPERAGQLNCGHYLKTGTCKYGSTCKYNHPKDRKADSAVSLNVLGLPMRQDAKPCPYYMRMGSCKYGHACKFHHPQPVSAANLFPIPEQFYSSGESGTVPKSGVQSTGDGEFSAASLLPRATYLPSPLFPLPQSYAPFIVSPSQSWNSYMGSISPLFVTSGQLSVSHLPERPNQPECRYFMSHGSCKYGPDCKYHHPRERILQLASSSLGPLGLPLRTGEPVFSWGGYPYAFTPMPAPYSPSVPYQTVQSHQVPS